MVANPTIPGLLQHNNTTYCVRVLLLRAKNANPTTTILLRKVSQETCVGCQLTYNVPSPPEIRRVEAGLPSIGPVPELIIGKAGDIDIKKYLDGRHSREASMYKDGVVEP